MAHHRASPPPVSWPSFNRLREEALILAEARRHQAIDEFWRGAHATLATAATHGLRAATRLAARLRRRHPRAEV